MKAASLGGARFQTIGDRPAIVLRFASHRLDIPLPLV
jgi:hypothetical protein